MSAIAIVTDTDASLPEHLASRHGIRQVPINVLFGNESLQTGIDIDDAALFARVDREGKLPTTSAPSPGQFAEAYQAALDAGAESVICFCVSGEVSATYAAAVAARDLVPEHDVTVVDTRNLSMAQGFMVLAAAEAAEAGVTTDEIIAHALAVGERIHLFAALSTMKYLAMSGRVSHLAAGMATVLSVKPILTLRDGKLDLLERVRTQRKAWSRAIELASESIAGRPIERLAIIHVNAAEPARRFEQLVRDSLECPEEIVFAELTPGLSVHSGAGIVGLVAVSGS